MKLTGAQIIVETLIEQGCDTVFGYPGGAVLVIYDELYKNSDRIRHIITAHEQGAAHAADGYARVTGKVGVCIATSGPGATNLVTGIANAYLDSTPLVAITGNVPLSLLGRDSFQEVDIAGITMPITKHNYIVKDVRDLANVIREAFKIAKSGRPGPVLIDIPRDVQAASCDFERADVVNKFPYPKTNKQSMEEAVELINSSKRPYIYSGGGVVLADAGETVLELAKKIDAPIGCSMMGLSAISADYKGMLGMTGMHGTYHASRAKQEADLIIAVGVRFSDRATGNISKYSKNAKIIHIDVDSAEIDKNVTTYLGILGNLNDVVKAITDKVEPRQNPEWFAEIEKMKEHAKTPDDYKTKLVPRTIIEKVQEYTTPDTVVATDVGQHQMWTAQYYKFRNPRTFATSGGLGTMGFGMGAAIGSCIGRGEKKTVLFTGDGSFGMNLNELATATSYNLPLVIVVMNNKVLGMVRQWQSLFYGKRYSNTTLNRKTDFVKLAEAFGATGLRATTVEELDKALETAFEIDTPVLIDCHIEMDEMVLPMIPPGGSIDDIIIK